MVSGIMADEEVQPEGPREGSDALSIILPAQSSFDIEFSCRKVPSAPTGIGDKGSGDVNDLLEKLRKKKNIQRE
jgi:hypothetical protein